MMTVPKRILETGLVLSLVACSLSLFSCTTIDLYEKQVSIPNHEWQSRFKPQFSFTVKDTTALYQVYVVLRHNDRYNWNNLWINLYTQAPGDSARRVQYELPLASKDKWLGSAMGDVYEHWILLTPQALPFKKAGDYVYTIEQIMREDPLLHVLNVGLRIEKKQQ